MSETARPFLAPATMSALLLLSCGSSSGSSGPSDSPDESSCRARITDSAGEAAPEFGCFCGPEAEASDLPPYPTECTATGVDGNSLCCKSDTDCSCKRVVCGPSFVDSSHCVCGFEIGIEYEVPACTTMGSLCCMTTTGYCRCNNDTECAFGSSPIAQCDIETILPMCDSLAEPVDRCE